ncbi:Maestro heat-like repeat-containing protein member 2A [Saguinus oedipus]|uniref:Maestro heat-like repeat-containing protein member 2A n=1 Tax=Saguinus oedipus TaxID=9490 RepID=A0ABQ9VFW8_SAGOE|nr:Maestro heat-like repeat-containing protein member 2A [Saguinus oedipus]
MVTKRYTPACVGQAVLEAEPTDNLVSPVKLKPFYSTEENSELIDISIHSVISLQLPGEDNESIKTLYANALNTLEQLMESLLQRQLDPRGLQEMVQILLNLFMQIYSF